MRVVNLSDIASRKSDSEHRGGGLEFVNLLEGREGTQDNYWFVIAKSEGARYSPRHRHNFDQFRYSLEGDLSIGTRKYVRKGEVGYFPEGTHYGPQDDAGVARTSLVLQFAGASGSGFVSQRQSIQAQKDLQQYGRFERGIFFRERGEGKKNQDGFEALWEHINQRKLTYPKKRYNEPVLLDPANFKWRDTDRAGVQKKLLGVFSERETRLECYRLEPGAALHVPAEASIRIGFVLEGSGTCAGKTFGLHSAFEGDVGDAFQLTADRPCEIMMFTIPSYETGRLASAAE